MKRLFQLLIALAFLLPIQVHAFNPGGGGSTTFLPDTFIYFENPSYTWPCTATGTSTAETTAAQAALDSLPGGSHAFLKGETCQTGVLVMPQQDITIEGTIWAPGVGGLAGSVLKQANGVNSASYLRGFSWNANVGVDNRMTFINFTIDGNAANNTTSDCFTFLGGQSTFSHLRFVNCPAVSLVLDDEYSNNTDVGQNLVENRVEWNLFQNSGTQAFVTKRDNAAGAARLTDGFFINNIINNVGMVSVTGAVATTFNSAGGWLVAGNHYYGNMPHDAIRVILAYATRVIHNYIEAFGTEPAATNPCSVDTCYGILGAEVLGNYGLIVAFNQIGAWNEAGVTYRLLGIAGISSNTSDAYALVMGNTVAGTGSANASVSECVFAVRNARNLVVDFIGNSCNNLGPEDIESNIPPDVEARMNGNSWQDRIAPPTAGAWPIGVHVSQVPIRGSHTGYSGTHTSVTSSPTILTDSTKAFTTNALAGATLINTTDTPDSSCTVASNTATTITCASALTGGTSNTFAQTNAYHIYDNLEILVDSTKNYVTNSLVGLTISNLTDGSSCVITANNATTVTCSLSGGTQNDWDTPQNTALDNDYYTINNLKAGACLEWVSIAGGSPGTWVCTGYIPMASVKTTPTGNIGAGEDTLWSQPVAAHSMMVDGDRVLISGSGGMADVGNNVTLKVKINSTTVLDSTAQNPTGAQEFSVNGWCIRVSATVLRCTVTLSTSGNALFQVSGYEAVGVSDLANNAFNVVITGEGTGNDDIALTMGAIEYRPAP